MIEHNPAVKTMKKGSSFFGYTLTSWKAVEGDIMSKDVRGVLIKHK